MNHEFACLGVVFFLNSASSMKFPFPALVENSALQEVN